MTGLIESEALTTSAISQLNSSSSIAVILLGLMIIFYPLLFVYPAVLDPTCHVNLFISFQTFWEIFCPLPCCASRKVRAISMCADVSISVFKGYIFSSPLKYYYGFVVSAKA